MSAPTLGALIIALAVERAKEAEVMKDLAAIDANRDRMSTYVLRLAENRQRVAAQCAAATAEVAIITGMIGEAVMIMTQSEGDVGHHASE